jgi:hypothetical protein
MFKLERFKCIKLNLLTGILRSIFERAETNVINYEFHKSKKKK